MKIYNENAAGAINSGTSLDTAPVNGAENIGPFSYYESSQGANKDLLLKSTVAIRMPLMNVMHSPFAKLQVLTGFGVGEDPRKTITFENLYRNWNVNQTAEFVAMSIIPKAIQQALAYHYFGYPVANRSVVYPPQGGNGAVPTYYPLTFGRTEDFGDSYTSKNEYAIGTYTDMNTYTSDLGKNLSPRYDFRIQGIPTTSTENGLYPTGEYPSKADPIALFPNFKDGDNGGELKYPLNFVQVAGGLTDAQSIVAAEIVGRNAAFSSEYQPVPKTHARLFNPGSLDSIVGDGVASPMYGYVEGYNNANFPSGFNNGGLNRLMGPYGKSKWYYSYVEGKSVPSEFKNDNLVTAYNLLLPPSPEQLTSIQNGNSYIPPHPTIVLDSIVPKVLDYILDVSPEKSWQQIKGTSQTSIGPSHKQPLQVDADSPPKQFNIAGINNREINNQGAQPEDFEYLGYTNVLGGYGGKSPYSPSGNPSILGGVVGKVGNDITVLPKDMRTLGFMFSVIRLGLTKDFGFLDGGLSGFSTQAASGAGQYDASVTGGINSLIDLMINGASESPRYKTNSDSIGQNNHVISFENSFEAFLDQAMKYGYSNYEVVKFISDAFLIALYKKIPYGSYDAKNSHGKNTGCYSVIENTLIGDENQIIGNHTPAIERFTTRVSLLGTSGDYEAGEVANSSSTPVIAKSDLLFPVWDYDKDRLSKMGYKPTINPSENDGEITVAQAKAIVKNPNVQTQVNSGTPDWVNSIQIYPSISDEYIFNGLSYGGLQRLAGYDGYHAKNNIVTNIIEDRVYGTTDNGIENNLGYPENPFLGGTQNARFFRLSESPNTIGKFSSYKDASGWISAGRPWVGLSMQGFNQEYNEGTGYYNAGGIPLIELRYVVEMKIDETKLITDMVRNKIFTVGGTSDIYEAFGFDVDQLLLATYGAVYSESLTEAYEVALSKQTGPEVDFSQFPFLITGESTAGQILPVDTYETIESVVQSTGDKKAITSLVFSTDGHPTVPIKSAPGIRAKNIGYVDNYTTVKVLKQWVNGKGDYNKIQIVDPRSARNGAIGFIEPENLVDLQKPQELIKNAEGDTLDLTFKVPNFFNKAFESKGYELAETEILPMSDMARALIPTWWKQEEPYYHREEGVYYHTVTLDHECLIDEADLEAKKKEAIKQGISELLDFYDKQYTVADVKTLSQVDLATRYVDYHIDARPGSKLKMQIALGGIYLHGFPDSEDILNKLKGESTKIISLDAPFYSKHIEQAIFGLNKMYIDIFAANVRIKHFNILKEAERLETVETFIKKLILLNGFDPSKVGSHVISIGFDVDYKLKFISYKEEGSKEVLLNIGLNYFKNQSPFADKNTMALFYYHRKLKDPTLTYQQLVEQILPAPKPVIEPRGFGDGFDYPTNRCAPPNFVMPPFSDIIDGLAQQLDHMLDLNPRFDLGAFEFSLRKFLPPCPKPPPGKGPALFKTIIDLNGEQNAYNDLELMFNLTKERDRINDYVGDFLTSAEALKDIKFKIIDLDDLHKYFTSMMDVPSLYNTICRCFLDLAGIDEVTLPNFEISASGGSAGASIGPALQGKGKNEIFDLKGPEGNISTDPITVDAADLYCSFCLEVPDLFVRLPTTNILQELIDALKALLEFVIAQLLLELIAALIEALLACPDIQCPPGQQIVKDYGGQNLNNLFDQTGVPTAEFFQYCGLVGVDPNDIFLFLEEVSKSVSSGEVLDLMDGSANIDVMETIDNIAKQYPKISDQLTTKAQLEDFFTCAGQQLPVEIIDQIEEDITNKFKDPEICKDLVDDAKKQLLDKCGALDGINKFAQRAAGADVDKYKQLADLIRKQNDLSTQMPPLFGDGKGNLGAMSSLNTPTMDYAVEQAVTSMLLPIEVKLTQDSKAFTRGSGKKGLVVEDPDLKQVLSFPAFVAAAIAPFLPDLSNRLANDVGDLTLGSIESYISLISTENAVKAKVNDENLVTLFLKPPIENKNGNLTYTDNYNILVKNDRFGSFTISPQSTGGITEEKRKKLEKYPLFNSVNICEQGQYFGNVVCDSLGIMNQTFMPNPALLLGETESSTPDAEIQKTMTIGDGAQGIREVMSKKLFLSIFNRMFRLFAREISEGELLKTFDANPFVNLDLDAANEKTENSFGIGLVDLIGDLRIDRREVENVDLTPVDIPNEGGTSSPTGIVDFRMVKEIIKKNYDFSEFYDPNSEELGMPQYAMLEGLVVAMVQTFTGEFFAKSMFVLSKIPSSFFLDDYSLVDVIVQEIKVFLNDPTRCSPNQAKIYKDVVYELIARKSEFTPDNPSSTSKTPVGKIYDPTISKEVPIENWSDATKYYIRQYYKGPINFIKHRLNNTKLKDNGVGQNGSKKIGQINPLLTLVYPNLLQIYNVRASSQNGVSPQSICAPSRITEFTNGRFFYQYYYKIEQWSPGDEFYNEELLDALYPGTDQLMSDENFSDFLKNLHDLIEQKKGGSSPFPSPVALAPSKIPLNNMFKDIKIGVRLCYGYAQTKDELLTTEGETFYQNQNLTGVYLNDMFSALLSSTEQTKSFELFQGVDEEEIETLRDIIQDKSFREKSLRCTEKPILLEGQTEILPEGVSVEEKLARVSIILPIFSNEQSIKNWDDGFTQAQKLKIVSFSKNLDEIVGLEPGEGVLDKFDDIVNEPRVKKVLFDLLSGIIGGEDFQTLFKYSFSIPKILYTLSIYSILAVSSSTTKDTNGEILDKGPAAGTRVNAAFDQTKKSLFSAMADVGRIKGREAYKHQSDDIKKRGGPSGIAKNSVKGAP